MNCSLVWLRRDLRLNDHAALAEALASDDPVQPVFVFDRDILARFDNPQDRRLTFLAETLADIHAKLQAKGGGLLVLYGRAAEDIPALSKALNARQVICEEDYEPGPRARDAAVKAAANARFVQVVDHVILAPGTVTKDDGTPYRVYTPFSKACRAKMTRAHVEERVVKLDGRMQDYEAACRAADDAGLKRLDASDASAMLSEMGYEKVELGEWTVHDVRERLHHYVQTHLESYKDRRDRLDDFSGGTSRLSPYMRHGLISIRECWRLASEYDNKGAQHWMSEILWREFYHHILHFYPDSIELEFQEQYRDLEWNQNEEWLQRWKDGLTGYPIVDAAMRELRETGFMHNRARMIVASFLTKDLHLDWRLGEEYFAQYLMDYELSSNVGGWQWAASTGTDAQPYFRIFNPELQSKRFDPEGKYIRRFVPELRELKGDDIHVPHKAKDLFTPLDYPEPIVEHHVEKDKAIAMFKANKGE